MFQIYSPCRDFQTQFEEGHVNVGNGKKRKCEGFRIIPVTIPLFFLSFPQPFRLQFHCFSFLFPNYFESADVGTRFCPFSSTSFLELPLGSILGCRFGSDTNACGVIRKWHLRKIKHTERGKKIFSCSCKAETQSQFLTISIFKILFPKAETRSRFLAFTFFFKDFFPKSRNREPVFGFHFFLKPFFPESRNPEPVFDYSIFFKLFFS